MNTSPDFREGDKFRNIALLGSCPGEEECRRGRPFIGETGQSLSIVISEISKNDPISFPSAVKDDYSLLNSHEKPRWKNHPSGDDTTEPSNKEVRDSQNIARLTRQIKFLNCDTILCFGEKAKIAALEIRKTHPNMSIFACRHPSKSSLNRCKSYTSRTLQGKLIELARDMKKI